MYFIEFDSIVWTRQKREKKIIHRFTYYLTVIPINYPNAKKADYYSKTIAVRCRKELCNCDLRVMAEL